jgi:proline iminopeptidase
MGDGDKAPLVCVHGGPGGSSCGYVRLSPLGDERKIILYDQLGSGHSERPADTSLWHVERFAEELNSLIQYLRIDEFHLYGHSWGASVVTDYVLKYQPEGLKSIILGSPLLSTPAWIEDAQILLAELPDSIEQIIKNHEEAGTTNSAEYQDAAYAFYKRFLFRKPYDKVLECEGIIHNDSIYNFMWGPSEFTATGNLKNYDRTDHLDELKIPVLIIIGEYDEARPQTMKKFQQKIPNSELIVIPDAAHATMADQPELYVKALREYLERTENQN